MDLFGLKLKKLEYNLEDLSFLREKLKFFDQYFNPLLSSLVELDSYAEKLLLNAYLETLFIRDKFIGFYAVYVNNRISDEAYFTLLAISNEYGGLGYGQYLLSRIVEISKIQGFKSLKLEVNIYNDKAICLYKKNGFIIIDEDNTGTATTYYMKKRLV